jgi:hypothetical protein
VAETRTARLNLPQWSSGTDSPSRDDFNQAFADLEVRMPLDRRAPDPALPAGSPAIVDAEYFQRTLTVGSDALRALYRSDSGGTWRAQNWIPETLRVRPPTASPPAVGLDALRIEHPTGPVTGVVASWEGTVTARKALILGNAADGALGRLSVGGLDAVPAAVRARITALGAERALEIKAGDSNVTELLRMIDSSGSNVLTVAGSGQLTSTQGAAFGGVSPAASASLTVGPQPSGAINTGLLGYGQESAPTRVIAQFNRFQPGSTDAASIFSVAPNAITIGRATAAWASSTLDLGAVTTRLVTTRLAWFPDYTTLSGSGTFSPFPGLTGFAGIDATNGMSSTVGTQFNNFGDPTRDAARFAIYPASTNNWPGDLSRWYQAEIISGSPDAVLVSRVDSAGRMSANAPWRGSGNKPNHLRDVRQPILHTCMRKWADPGDYPAGQYIASNGSFTYTWPSMTVRSASITQLEVELRLEALFFKLNSGASPDRQVMQIRWSYQLGGSGSYNSVDNLYQEAASMVADSAYPQAPGIQNTWTAVVPITVSAGTTFRLRMQVVLYPYAVDARLRRADLKVRESIVETYTASE